MRMYVSMIHLQEIDEPNNAKYLIVTSECMYDENIEVDKLPFRKDRPSEWTTIVDNCQKKGRPCLYVYIIYECMYTQIF